MESNLEAGVLLPGNDADGNFLAIGFTRQSLVSAWEPRFEKEDTDDPLGDSATECIDVAMTLQPRPGPYSRPLKDTDFVGNVFYVHTGAEGGDGSREKPFPDIPTALAGAEKTEKTAVILVAEGVYNGDFALKPGQFLFGGFDPATWERDLTLHESVVRNQANSLTVLGGNQSLDFPVILDGFTLYGAVETNPAGVHYAAVPHPTVVLAKSSALILRNNTLYMSMADVTWTTYGDTHYGRVVEGNGAAAQIYHNRFLIDSSQPEKTISTALFLRSTCFTAANNHFRSFRTSLTSEGGRGTFFHNLIEDGSNGLNTFNEELRIDGNTIGLLEHESGCGYALYLGHFGDIEDTEPPTRPAIVHNTIILEGSRAKGINEVYREGDPKILTENRFVLVDPSITYMLYGDYDGSPDAGRINQALSHIDEVNGLTDVPDVGGNVAE